jgi:hypothetical protein
MSHPRQFPAELATDDRPARFCRSGRYCPNFWRSTASRSSCSRRTFPDWSLRSRSWERITSASGSCCRTLLQDELDTFLRQVEDPGYRWHVHAWSVFPEVVAPAFEAKARAKYPIPDGCSYWQHSEGTMWAVNAGRGVDHLWRWDGLTPELLEEALTHWVA